MATRRFCRDLLKWLLVVSLSVLLLSLAIQIGTIELDSNFEEIKNQINEIDKSKIISTSDAPIGECIQGRNCRLPECLCFGIEHYPDNFQGSEVPQIVIFTSDDHLNAQFADFYGQIFDNHKNPNDCPFTGTLFISGSVDNNFRLVRQFYDGGWEIGQHGMKHLAHDNTDILKADINEMRMLTHKETGIPFSELIGWRSPYLHTLMDGEIETLKNLSFKYSMTFGTKTYAWPFTLDFGFMPIFSERSLKATSRFWIIPNTVYDARPFSDRKVSYVDDIAASWSDPRKLNNASEIERILNAAFTVHYHGDRSPFLVNIHGNIFNRNPETLPAMIKFFKTLDSLSDVFVLSAHKALQWAQNPAKLRDIHKFGPWKC